jgi:hypothetical protein
MLEIWDFGSTARSRQAKYVEGSQGRPPAWEALRSVLIHVARVNVK